MGIMLTNEPNGLHATGVQFFQALFRKGALEMELVGMKRRGQSAYSICKQVYGFRGSREKVADLMNQLIDALIAEKQGVATASQLMFLDSALPMSVFSPTGCTPQPTQPTQEENA